MGKCRLPALLLMELQPKKPSAAWQSPNIHKKPISYFHSDAGAVRVILDTFVLPLYGYPDVLGAIVPAAGKNGVFTPVQGDGFVMFVTFGPDGVGLETSQAYGNSNHPDSPHYTDQMPLYVNRQTKTMSLNRADVLKNAVRIYTPGR